MELERATQASEAALTVAQAEVIASADRVASVQAELESLREGSSSHSEQFERLQAEKREAEARLAELETAQAQSEEHLQSLHAENARLKEAVEAGEKSTADGAEASAARVAQLEGELRDVGEKLEELRKRSEEEGAEWAEEKEVS